MMSEDAIKAAALHLEQLLTEYHRSLLPKEKTRYGTKDTAAAKLARLICEELLSATDAEDHGGCPLCWG